MTTIKKYFDGGKLIETIDEYKGTHSAAVDDDIRVIWNIEYKARKLQVALDRLNARWENRTEKMAKNVYRANREVINFGYVFDDILNGRDILTEDPY